MIFVTLGTGQALWDRGRLGSGNHPVSMLWMNLQNRYDVELAKREIGKKLDKIEPIIGHAAA